MQMRRWMAAVLFSFVFPLHAQPMKNLQILTGLSRPEIERVMNQMRAGLGVHCHHCHAYRDAASEENPNKGKAREMIRMVMELNARHFGGKPVVTCFTCHNGKPRPALFPPLPQAVPPDPQPVDPKSAEAKPAETKAFPAVAALVQKYVAAVGREATPATPRLLKGTLKSPTGPQVQAAMAMSGETTRIDLQLPDGSPLTRTTDGNAGWVLDKNGVRDLQPDELVRSRLFRRAFAPFYTSTLGDDAKVVDSEKIGERTAWIVAARTARYWFDAENGLLLRRVTYHDSPVGRIPEQTDFDDYRDAGGLKLPYLVRAAVVDPWLGGTLQAESIDVRAAMPPFEKPSPPPAPPG